MRRPQKNKKNKKGSAAAGGGVHKVSAGRMSTAAIRAAAIKKALDARQGKKSPR